MIGHWESLEDSVTAMGRMRLALTALTALKTVIFGTRGLARSQELEVRSPNSRFFLGIFKVQMEYHISIDIRTDLFDFVFVNLGPRVRY